MSPSRGAWAVVLRRIAGCTLAGLVVNLVAPVSLVRSAPPAFEVHRIQSSAIGESSGLVQSRRYPGVFWTHNDSGDRARIFAIDREGRLLKEIAVVGAKNVDWEDITVDDSGHLYLGDFGNNSSNRRDLTVYRIAEPDPRGKRLNVELERTLRFRYADQVIGRSPPNFDAESMIWLGGSLYVFSKDRADTLTRIYRLADRPGDEEQVLTPLGSLEIGPVSSMAGNATGASASADGKHIALLTYTAIYVYERGAGAELLPLKLVNRIALNPLETRQTEGIAWDGDALLVSNEQRDLFRIAKPIKLKP